MKNSGSHGCYPAHLASFRVVVCGVFLFVAMGVSPRVQAQVCTTNWTNASGGSWSNGQNWDTGDPPGSSDIVCIDLDSGYNVNLGANVSIQGLILGSDTNQATQALSIIGSYSLGVQDGITVYGSGALYIYSDAAVWGASNSLMQSWGFVGLSTGQIALDFENYGQLQFVGMSRIFNAFVNKSGASISPVDYASAADLQLDLGMQNSGTIYLVGSDNLSITVLDGYQLENEPGGMIRAGENPVKQEPRSEKAGTMPPSIIGDLYNDGDLWVGDNGVRLTGDGLSSSNEGTGVIQLVYGNLELDLIGDDDKTRAASSFTNLGSIDIGAGMSFDVSTTAGKTGSRAASSFTNLGSIDIGAGSSFNIAQSSKATRAASSFTNLGSIDIGAGGTFLCEGASFANEQNTKDTEGIISGVGTLDLSAVSSVYNNAAIEPGTAASAGEMTYYGSLVQHPSASLRFDLGGRTPGSYDVLTISAAMQKVGSLELNLVDGFVPVAGDSFEILSYQGAEGSYASTALFPSLDGGLGWTLHESQSHTSAQVICETGDDLRILEVSQDKDPVSIDSILTFDVLLESVNGNSGVLLDVDLGSYLILDQVYVGDCVLVGTVLSCSWDDLFAEDPVEVIFSVYPTISGDLPLPFTLSGDFCETESPDNSWNATVHAIAAAPCDANDDGVVDENDLPFAVGQFYGTTAPGNPDCSDDGVLDAKDLALIDAEAGS